MLVIIVFLAERASRNPCQETVWTGESGLLGWMELGYTAVGGKSQTKRHDALLSRRQQLPQGFMAAALTKLEYGGCVEWSTQLMAL